MANDMQRLVRQEEETDFSVGAGPDGRDNALEASIGRQVREFRRKLDMTVVELARIAGLSAGMLSKIENGITSPSLSTLQALSRALNVPVTSLFRKFEERRDATYIQGGEGCPVSRRGTRSGYSYRWLGHTVAENHSFEPYLLEIPSGAEVEMGFQHGGVEFIWMLSGRMLFRHGEQCYDLGPNDSLFFDAELAHGPLEFVTLPIRAVVMMSAPSEA